jgi:hypothetical protein
MRDDTVREVLRIALSAAVPLHVMELQRLSWAEVSASAKACGDIIAEKGDVLQFRGKKRGESAKAFNALARGLAALSFAPGGVTFLGDHYENTWKEKT